MLEDYLKRGGGLVSFHDTLCGDDPAVVLDDRRRRQEARRAELLVRRDQVHHRRQGVADHEGHVGLRDQRRGVLHDDVGQVARASTCWRRRRCRPSGRSGAADLDLRAHDLRRPAVPRVRLDAGAHLHQLHRTRRSRRCSCAASPGPPTIRSTRSSTAARPPVAAAVAAAVRAARNRQDFQRSRASVAGLFRYAYLRVWSRLRERLARLRGFARDESPVSRMKPLVHRAHGPADQHPQMGVAWRGGRRLCGPGHARLPVGARPLG